MYRSPRRCRHQLAGPGIGLDEILAQGHRLLHRVDGALDGGEREHIPRKAQAVLRSARGTDEFSIVRAVHVVRQTPLVGLSLFKLRVVEGELLIWSYIGELVFSMLVLVGAVKMADRVVREMMGL